MPAKKITDKFANIVQKSLANTVANELVFEEFNFGLNIFDKVGLIIHRIDYAIAPGAYNLLVDNSDHIEVALTQSNQLTGLSLIHNAVVDKFAINVASVAAAADYVLLLDIPWTHDFTGLPNGGILVAPKPLYMGIRSAGLAAVISGTMRVSFTVIPLKGEEYFELLESRRFFG